MSGAYRKGVKLTDKQEKEGEKAIDRTDDEGGSEAGEKSRGEREGKSRGEKGKRKRGTDKRGERREMTGKTMDRAKAMRSGTKGVDEKRG